MMQPYQQRVVAEHDELYVRWVKLGKFLGDATQEQVDEMGMEEYRRLSMQYTIMGEYVTILALRIDNFNQ